MLSLLHHHTRFFCFFCVFLGGGVAWGALIIAAVSKCRSLEGELHLLLPVLLSYAPRIKMREASAALLRTRFGPSLLHVSVMNDPLSLER